jgi:hypothetical protein
LVHVPILAGAVSPLPGVVHAKNGLKSELIPARFFIDCNGCSDSEELPITKKGQSDTDAA